MKTAMQKRVEEAVAETEAKASGLRDAREKNVHFSARVVALNARVAAQQKDLRNLTAINASLTQELEQMRSLRSRPAEPAPLENGESFESKERRSHGGNRGRPLCAAGLLICFMRVVAVDKGPCNRCSCSPLHMFAAAAAAQSQHTHMGADVCRGKDGWRHATQAAHGGLAGGPADGHQRQPRQRLGRALAGAGSPARRAAGASSCPRRMPAIHRTSTHLGLERCLSLM